MSKRRQFYGLLAAFEKENKLTGTDTDKITLPLKPHRVPQEVSGIVPAKPPRLKS